MIRVIALLAALYCVCPAVASDDIAVALGSTQPAAVINFDGSHHVDICHKKQESAPQSQSAPQSDLTFEKSDSSDAPTGVLVGAAVIAVAVGVAVQWNRIAKSTVAVH